MTNFENEKIESNPESETKKLITIEESREIATQLLTLYEPQIKENLGKDVDGWGEFYTDYQDSIQHFLEIIPESIREHYQGHGIIRKDSLDRLTAALNIMANQTIKGEHGPLVGGNSADIKAFQNNIEFLIISKLDKPLHKVQEKDGRSQPIYNEMGQWEAEIGAFVVNTKYYPLVNELKKMFPNINIIKANELNNFFEIKG